MNENKFKEKLLEFLSESSKPKKFEVGFVQGNRTINDGLVILGMNATDILGFAKPANERRTRKVKGAQAWFKKMYEDGWRYKGTFEQEGLLHNGFVVMERELPNKVLDAIREELEVILKEDEGAKYIHVPDPGIVEMTIDKLQKLMPVRQDYDITGGYAEGFRKAEEKLKLEKRGDLEKAILKTREPREGFESDVNDFMIGAKKEMKTLEESFFEETGKNAVWRGKETIAFKSWKEGLENAE